MSHTLPPWHRCVFRRFPLNYFTKTMPSWKKILTIAATTATFGAADQADCTKASAKLVTNFQKNCKTPNVECPDGVQDDIDDMYSECGGAELDFIDGEKNEGKFDVKAKTLVPFFKTCGCSAGSAVAPSLVMAAAAVFAQFM